MKSKSKAMKMGGEKENLNILWKGKVMEQMASHEYLGTAVNEQGTEEEEINNKMSYSYKIH